jgi:DNA-directed RNA polymerase beta subunit
MGKAGELRVAGPMMRGALPLFMLFRAMGLEADEEIGRILLEQEKRARVMLEKHRAGLDLVAQSLLDNETIDGAMVSRLVQQGLGQPTRRTEGETSHDSQTQLHD